MFVDELAELFKDYIDESDDSFVDTAKRTRYLKMGYDEFRRLASQYDPTIYQTVVDIVLSNVTEYDFALTTNPVRLLGKPAAGLTGPRLLRLSEMSIKYSNQPPYGQMPWVGVKSIAELSQGSWGTYLFVGTKLQFPFNINGTLSIRYIGVPIGPDWTKQAPGDDERIDDLEDWHDLIALMAAQQYNIRDNAANAELQRKRAERTLEFQMFLCNGRDFTSSTRISMTYNP